GGEHGGTAQRVSDKNCRRTIVGAQMVGGEDKVLDVGGEIGALKLSLGGSEPREVEPQDCNAERGQLGGNASGRDDVLGACKAVREQRMRAYTSRRPVQ